MGKFTNILLAGVFIFWVLIWAWDSSNASPERVGAVMQKSEKSADAKRAVTTLLKSNPNPTNSQINEVEHKIDEFLVRDLARKQTGDMKLKTSSEIEEEQNAKNQEELNREISNPIFSIGKLDVSMVNLLMISILIIVISFGIKFVRKEY